MRLVVVLMFIALLSLQQQSFAQVLSGSVNKEHVVTETGTVLDRKTGKPIAGAVVSLPSEGVSTLTDRNGEFQLHLPDGKPVILSVKKDGFKPFSLAVDKQHMSNPLKIAIAEQTKHDIIIDSRLHHLGDDKFSERSANAGDFSAPAVGPYFFQEFYVDDINPAGNIVLKIGSIIGIDTRIAQSLRQSRVSTSSSSPVTVYLNSQRIGEISFNGDNHTFRVPHNLIRPNRYNVVKIETGVNLESDRDIDYDDIEFMNLFLEVQ